MARLSSFIERSALALIALIAILGGHDLCNLFFRCGCHGLSEARCNIHHAMGPHCPWCTASWHAALAGIVWIAAAAGAIALSRRAFGRRAPITLAAGLCGFAVGALASAVITARLTGYPHLF